jgi:Neuraminidase (sialidase)
LSRKRLCQNQEESSKNSVYFVIYRNGKLFQGDDKEKKENKKEDTSKEEPITKAGFFQWFLAEDENTENEDTEEKKK